MHDEIQLEFEHLIQELMDKHKLSYLTADFTSSIRYIMGTDGQAYPCTESIIYDFHYRTV